VDDRWAAWGDDSLVNLLKMYDSGEIMFHPAIADSLRAEVSRRRGESAEGRR
jgi:hypothetical protein